MKNIIFSLATLGLAFCGFDSVAQTVSGQVGGYDYVDLGLDVNWATYNVGATKPTEYGGYFAWGETEPKEDYSWATYKWCEGSFDSITRYCIKRKLGKRDKYTELIPKDDAATVNLGEAWRMPTFAELQALVEHCNWEWTKDYEGSGVSGLIGISKSNGNTIFLPAAGFRDGVEFGGVGLRGQYVAKQISELGNCDVFYIWFRDTSIEEDDNIERYIGNSIRAVTTVK